MNRDFDAGQIEDTTIRPALHTVQENVPRISGLSLPKTAG
jgi:hypothetical protein